MLFWSSLKGDAPFRRNKWGPSFRGGCGSLCWRRLAAASQLQDVPCRGYPRGQPQGPEIRDPHQPPRTPPRSPEDSIAPWVHAFASSLGSQWKGSWELIFPGCKNPNLFKKQENLCLYSFLASTALLPGAAEGRLFLDLCGMGGVPNQDIGGRRT